MTFVGADDKADGYFQSKPYVAAQFDVEERLVGVYVNSRQRERERERERGREKERVNAHNSTGRFWLGICRAAKLWITLNADRI